MTTHIHLDLIGGLAGDMFLAAALDAGVVAVADVEAALSALGFGDIGVHPERVRRGAISGVHVRFGGWSADDEADHRHLSEILEMLDASGLDQGVRARAASMFDRLGRAESRIHDIPMERVHFHEVGALDSIFDFVAAAYILEHGAQSWSFGAVPTGLGTIETDHGTMPLPAPATADLLRGIEVSPTSIPAELVTPTGATILAEIHANARLEAAPRGSIRATGFGAGTRDMRERANVVRFTVMDANPRGAEQAGDQVERLVQLTCDVDDMNPEHLAHVETVLFARGALDVVRLSASMKKGRQGVRLSVLGRPEDHDALLAAIMAETTTFGVRSQTVERFALERELVEVDTPWGAVVVKIGSWRGEVIKAAPEYDDCARLAAAVDVPLRRIYRAAQAAIAQEIG